MYLYLWSLASHKILDLCAESQRKSDFDLQAYDLQVFNIEAPLVQLSELALTLTVTRKASACFEMASTPSGSSIRISFGNIRLPLVAHQAHTQLWTRV